MVPKLKIKRNADFHIPASASRFNLKTLSSV